MAKFTLHFKNKVVEVFHLDEGKSTIGRDSSNTFPIESLAIAPTHLAISYEDGHFYVESISEQFPSFINGKAIEKQLLQQGDKIFLSKHVLTFTEDTIDYQNLPNRTLNKNNNTNSSRSVSPTANIQIMSGSEIGRVISLQSALTEIKDGDNVPAIIAKRQSGYFISKLIDDVSIYINGTLTDNEAKLENNAKLRVANKKFVFFIE